MKPGHEAGWMMLRPVPVALLIAGSFVFAAQIPRQGKSGDDAIVTISGGRILGAEESPGSSVRVFRGIPYARPPVGDLRWKPPEEAAPWEGVRECTTFGPSCPQPEQNVVRGIAGPQSEDCLYLNVWTASREGEKRPVMVWIHGGGFTIGSGSQRTYNGFRFAGDGIVLVTINYRLGPFGFMAHPALSAESPANVSGNYGLMDQIAALRWVRRNIGAFGGDSANVTVFGESAGSASVGCLIASPLARGLFSKAIMESGVPLNLPRLRSSNARDTTAESAGVTIARAAGVEDPESASAATAELLRELPAEKLLAAANPRVGLFGKGRRMGPVVDGEILREEPLETYAAGTQNRVPVIIGTNADEGTLFIGQIPIRRPAGYRIAVARLFGDFAARVLDLFPVRTPADVRPALARLVTVGAFVAPARRVARLLGARGTPVWLYHFTRVPAPLRERGMGATHGTEILYVFGALPKLLRPDDTDSAVSEAMHAAWVRFASTGDPNGDGLPPWPSCTRQNDAYFEFGDRAGAGSGLMSSECDLFDEISEHRPGGGGLQGN